MRRALAALALVGCAAPPEPVSIYREPARTTPHIVAPRPDWPGWGAALNREEIRWSAETLADDFIELTFVSEWGAVRDRLLRWEEPVRVALSGPELAAYRSDAAALIARIAAGAPGLDIALAPEDEANITLRTAPAEAMAQVAPDALCFLIPFSGEWRAWREAEARGVRVWEGLERLDAITIFLPTFAAPHEIRACMEEEIAQALGPMNDIMRLEDSVFNDDNARGALTSFDLLMLRILYDPEMRTGMSPVEARRTALTALARPGTPRTGDRLRRRAPADPIYADLVTRAALAPVPAAEALWAERALVLAESFGPYDHRRGAATLEAGRAAFFDGRSKDAIRLLRRAEEIFLATLGPDSPRLADTRTDLGAILTQAGRPEEALVVLDAAIPALGANADAWSLAHAFRWRALALAESGNLHNAAETAREALDWARYVYGADSAAARGWALDFAAIGLAPG
ncbi:DUF2927 domain-containing protein [Pikeienuella piscinae]|uniref:DUF2927 domain-containing protein n=1 Tax=Pikeienuella piscinae TaxID=2748098 RepID=A0A7L5BWQ2_9RHOB|nr:DUF2927 domain-containing protein [Pikeienuella piscinae]QIE55258.1 DUF2927 domain-containing protein [Pikeienuella piscinae]